LQTSLHDQKYLIYALIGIFALWLSAYLLGKTSAIISSDISLVVLTMFMTMIAIFRGITSTNKTSRMTWILFSLVAISWLAAEHIWSLDELILDVKPFPSYADIGYLTGSAILPAFFIMLLLPYKKFISKRTILSGILSGGIIFSVIFYLALPSNYNSIGLTEFLLNVYPALDGIALVPALICVILFYKKKMGVSSFVLFCAVLSTIIGDILYQINTTNGTYYSGSLTDLFYYMQYTLFIFGAYGATKIDVKQDVNVKNI
jgi:hypothetical protein